MIGQQNYYSPNTIVSDWSTENNRLLYHQKYNLIEESVIDFLNPDAYQNYLGIF